MGYTYEKCKCLTPMPSPGITRTQSMDPTVCFQKPADTVTWEVLLKARRPVSRGVLHPGRVLWKPLCGQDKWPQHSCTHPHTHNRVVTFYVRAACLMTWAELVKAYKFCSEEGARVSNLVSLSERMGNGSQCRLFDRTCFSRVIFTAVSDSALFRPSEE